MLDKQTRSSRKLILVGIVGSLVSVFADLALAFFPQGVHGFETVFTVNVEKVFTVLSQASHTRLLFSNYLAMVGIPLGWFGLYGVYRQLRNDHAPSFLSGLVIVAGSIAYLCGLLFHVSLSYIATAFRLRPQVGVPGREVVSQMIGMFIDFSQPLAYTFQVALLIISIAFLVLAFVKRVGFSRWLGIANPVVIQLVLAVIATVLPLSGKTFVTVSVYNFSLLIFYSLCYLDRRARQD